MSILSGFPDGAGDERTAGYPFVMRQPIPDQPYLDN
jgi:hypothetical protein